MRQPADNRSIKRILVPTDGSEGAREAAEYAARLAGRFGASVTLLHVMDTWLILKPFRHEQQEQLRQELLENGKAILTLAQTAFAHAGIGVERELREGYPGDVIGQVASEGEYDLIVIGSRGAGMSNSWLLGNVSQQVARSAPCPVLITRGQPDANKNHSRK